MREKIKIGLTAEQWQDIADALHLAQYPLNQDWNYAFLTGRHGEELEKYREALQDTSCGYAELKKELIEKAAKKGLELDKDMSLRR